VSAQSAQHGLSASAQGAEYGAVVKHSCPLLPPHPPPRQAGWLHRPHWAPRASGGRRSHPAWGHYGLCDSPHLAWG
jgi:hypothetical protein